MTEHKNLFNEYIYLVRVKKNKCVRYILFFFIVFIAGLLGNLFFLFLYYKVFYMMRIRLIWNIRMIINKLYIPILFYHLKKYTNKVA